MKPVSAGSHILNRIIIWLRFRPSLFSSAFMSSIGIGFNSFLVRSYTRMLFFFSIAINFYDVSFWNARADFV
jgi:hypothetical protein